MKFVTQLKPSLQTIPQFCLKGSINIQGLLTIYSGDLCSQFQQYTYHCYIHSHIYYMSFLNPIGFPLGFHFTSNYSLFFKLQCSPFHPRSPTVVLPQYSWEPSHFIHFIWHGHISFLSSFFHILDYKNKNKIIIIFTKHKDRFHTFLCVGQQLTLS